MAVGGEITAWQMTNILPPPIFPIDLNHHHPLHPSFVRLYGLARAYNHVAFIANLEGKARDFFPRSTPDKLAWHRPTAVGEITCQCC
jgi:hypothetical protein